MKNLRAGQILSGLYGHGNKGGKLFSYVDRFGMYRTGQQIIVQFRHWISKELVTTMFTVKSTHGAGTVSAENIDGYMDNKGIKLRDVKGGPISQLPGYKRFANMRAPVKDWKIQSKRKYDLMVRRRLNEELLV